MKKFIILFAATIFFISSVFSEESLISNNKIPGVWLGKMKVSDHLELRFGFVITEKENGELSATMNVIEQKAFDIQMDIVTFVNDSLHIELSAAGISYAGKYDFETNVIEGTYMQGEANLKLNLHEVDELPRGEVVRPQTPVRPFPYIEEEVVFENRLEDIKLAGTLTLPRSKSPSPAIILVAGSGHTDRNETPMGHFLLLADYLTRSGYVVLRYDKRGVGESTGNYDEATSFNFAEDVKAGVNYLKNRDDVDANNIGIFGHSEGALLAPMVASQSENIGFIVLIGAIGIPCDELMLLQTEKIAKINGVPQEEITTTLKHYRKYYDIIKSNDDNSTKREKIIESNPEIADGLLSVMLMPWFQYFIQINPDEYFEKVNCPVLVINGQNDVQCAPKENLDRIKEVFENSGNKDYTIKTLPNLNHLLQTSKSGSPTEYEQITEIIAPSALELMGNWVNERIKN